MFFSEGDKVRLSSALKNAKSYEDVRKIIDKPNHEIKVRISFFGVSKISIKGFSFSTSVDNLAYKIERMVEEKIGHQPLDSDPHWSVSDQPDRWYAPEKKL